MAEPLQEPTDARADVRVALVIALTAALVRVVRWSGAAVLMNDGPVYIDLARRIAAGDFASALAHDYHPGYPVALRLFAPLFGDWAHAGAAVSIAAGAVAALGLFTLLRRAFDARCAALGALLFAVHPIWVEMADVQSDTLYFACFVWSAAALWRALAERSARAAFAAGLLSGLAYLVRPEGLGTLVVGLGLIGLELARRRWSLAPAARAAALLCLGGALVAAPYVAHLSARAGELVLTKKKSVSGVTGAADVRSWLGSGAVRPSPAPPLDPLLQARPDLVPPAKGVRAFRDAPVATGAARYPAAARQLADVLLKALRPEWLVLLAFGLFAARGAVGQRGRFFAAYTVLYLAVLFGLAASASYVSRRHVLPPGTLLSGYAALGVSFLGGALSRAPLARGRLGARGATVALTALICALALGKGLRPDRQGALSERLAAEWIAARPELAPDEAVAAVKQRVGYYAGARFVDLRRGPHPDLLAEYLRRERVRWVVVDEDDRAELETRLARSVVTAELVHRAHAPHGDAFVYELREP